MYALLQAEGAHEQAYPMPPITTTTTLNDNTAQQAVLDKAVPDSPGPSAAPPSPGINPGDDGRGLIGVAWGPEEVGASSSSSSSGWGVGDEEGWQVVLPKVSSPRPARPLKNTFSRRQSGRRRHHQRA